MVSYWKFIMSAIAKLLCGVHKHSAQSYNHIDHFESVRGA